MNRAQVNDSSEAVSFVTSSDGGLSDDSDSVDIKDNDKSYSYN